MNKVDTCNYESAFLKFWRSEPKGFEIQEYYENGPKLVKFKNVVYKVYSESDMYNHFKEALTDVYSAAYIPVSNWSVVAEDIYYHPLYIQYLIEQLSEKSEFENLNLALSLTKQTSNNPYVFWSVIHSLDDIGLYAKAIVASTKVVEKLDYLISDLIEEMTNEGIDTFTEMKNGVFETIYLNEDSNKETTFYIFTADPIHWEDK